MSLTEELNVLLGDPMNLKFLPGCQLYVRRGGMTAVNTQGGNLDE